MSCFDPSTGSGLSMTGDNMKTIQTLLYLKSLVWLVYAIYALVEYFDSHVKSGFVIGLIILLFLNAILFAVFSFLLNRKKKWLFYVVVLFLTANIVLTLIDQLSFFDSFVLVFDFVLLNLIFLKRKDFK